MSSNPDVAGLMPHRNTVREKRSATASFYSPALYRDRNAVERMFGMLKDFRRIATRYDRRADVYLSVVCPAAAVSDCLWVRSLERDRLRWDRLRWDRLRWDR